MKRHHEFGWAAVGIAALALAAVIAVGELEQEPLRPADILRESFDLAVESCYTNRDHEAPRQRWADAALRECLVGAMDAHLRALATHDTAIASLQSRPSRPSVRTDL